MFVDNSINSQNGNKFEEEIVLNELCKPAEPQTNCTATTAKTTTKNVGVECVCNDYAQLKKYLGENLLRIKK